MAKEILDGLELHMGGLMSSLKHAALHVLAEAHKEIKAAELHGDGVRAKDMLERHTRAAKVLNALQNLEGGI